jgi:hypothetical protein
MCNAYVPIFNLVRGQYPEDIESNGTMNYELETIWKDGAEAWPKYCPAI